MRANGDQERFHWSRQTGAHWFEVTVRDAQAMKMGNGQNHLRSVQARQILVKNALPVELEKQVPAIHKIQHQVQLARRLQAIVNHSTQRRFNNALASFAIRAKE